MMNPFLPAPNRVPDEAEVWRWYQNIEFELADISFTPAERASLISYYEEAGLLRPWRKGFFRRHYASTVAASCAFLLGHGGVAAILDLGCGLGTQSLLFALCGARVVSLDADGLALEVLEKRKRFYEGLSGRELCIECYQANSLTFDYGSCGGLDGIFSMFAFNMMQPSSTLVDRIQAATTSKARLAILDGNNRSWLARLLPSRRRSVWSPGDFEHELKARGWRIVHHRGAVSLPPVLWREGISSVLRRADDLLNGSWLFPISHLIFAQRDPGA